MGTRLLILCLVIIFLSSIVIFAPDNLFEKSAITVPIQNVRNRFNLDEDIEVILTGDVMLGRTVMTTALDANDSAYPFRKVKDTLAAADLVFVNLENPVIENCPSTSSGLVFCADPRMLEGFNFAGVDVVSLANNHSANYGEEGLKQTKKFLSEKGIEYTRNSLVVKEIGGVAFGFVGFEFIDKNITEEQIELVRAFDGQVDVLIAGIHWGSEYQATAGDRQHFIAGKLVDGGADVVVGHHPHWVQDIEYMTGVDSVPTQGRTKVVPVYYSLGNFVFDQMWSEKTREGLAIRLTFDSSGDLKKEEKLPIYMKDWAQPEFLD